MSRVGWRTALLDHRNAVLGIVSGVLGVVAAAGGVWGTVATASYNASSNALAGSERQLAIAEAELTEANAAIDAQRETISTLRADNADLQALVSPTIDLRAIPNIRTSGRITLADDGDSIDLDSTAPNFGAGIEGYSPFSLKYRNSTLVAGYSLSMLQLREGTAGYEMCAVATGYRPAERIEPHTLQSGTTCLRLSPKRFATVVTERYDEASVDLTIVVWE
ncbi:hypothetical protein [Agromyces sp. CCNWLW203]|uniref:hypothetical protein n=1 Tax=Agromyces sp. CCNWLW203 TaxID=3112842 RepID=UPI002F961A90